MPVTRLSALLLKFQKGHSENKKYIQLLVKLMSCCRTLRDIDIIAKSWSFAEQSKREIGGLALLSHWCANSYRN